MMSFKRIIFWAHLVTGVAAGLIIFVMSATGVILTYERQIVASIELHPVERADPDAVPLTADELVPVALALTGAPDNTQLLFQANEQAPVTVLSGRRTAGLLDPYTGAELENKALDARAFFNWNRALHRWLALEGASRKTGKAITGVANLGFIFIIVSGLYLWLPKIFRWQVIKANALFRRRYVTPKARDYNWHHVFGIWALVPLFVLATTATVFSYGWASDFVVRIAGTAASEDSAPAPAVETNTGGPVPIDMIVQDAKGFHADWNRIRLSLPDDSGTSTALVDTGSGGEPTKRTTLTYDMSSGRRVHEETFADINPGRRARIFIRYLHTGEVYGLLGQTIAGLASLAACFLVYTGLALAYRRLMPSWAMLSRSDTKTPPVG